MEIILIGDVFKYLESTIDKFNITNLRRINHKSALSIFNHLGFIRIAEGLKKRTYL